jgi:acetyl esterase
MMIYHCGPFGDSPDEFGAAAPHDVYPVLDADTQAYLDILAESGRNTFRSMAPIEARNALEALQHDVGLFVSGTDVQDLNLPVGPTGSVGIRIVRPTSQVGELPVLLFLHGGGWAMGSRDTYDRLLNDLCLGAGVAVVFVDYTLAPEARFPIQNEQAYAVLTYISSHAGELGLDRARIGIAGDGAGGNMAAVLTMLAQQRRGPAIAFQLLFYPVTAPPGESRSYSTFKYGPWLTANDMFAYVRTEFPDNTLDDPTAMPAKASFTSLERLPPALVVTAENDVLRDEGEAYARKLIQAGVAVIATRYLGTIHDFVTLNGLADTPPTRAALAQACKALRTHLGR